MKVIDVFPFFNELDILEIRLNVLDPYVDYFIISEATKTFSGIDKPLFYSENKERFSKFSHKIIHNIVEDTTSSDLHPYQRDVFQKDKIKDVVLENSSEDDIIIWSDIDEVPNPEAIKDIREYFEQNVIFHFAQENCMGYLNLVEVSGTIRGMTPDWDYGDRPRWMGTKVFGRSILEKYTLSELRSIQEKEKNSRIFPGGWHWSYVGSEGLSVEERVLKKIECAAHSELNTEQIKQNVAGVKDNKDPLGRHYANYQPVPLDDYPEYILKNKDKFADLIK
jgi:beta-1,4-mannosyl-glycoprotein beta-1,4-N-acetylglucosaminyltransferase|tara:strand:- start:6022 stop:6858 length:837 start_codon:yes stop_codon:yes gene_type:complete